MTDKQIILSLTRELESLLKEKSELVSKIKTLDKTVVNPALCLAVTDYDSSFGPRANLIDWNSFIDSLPTLPEAK